MDTEVQLESFIARFSDEVADGARAAIGRLRALLPAAQVLVYDNYGYLAVGFGLTEKASEAVFSIAVYPRWLNLFFQHGYRLDDPDGLLKGDGSRVRHIQCRGPEVFDDPRVRALMDQALVDTPWLRDAATPGRVVIKSISAKQRPRRPARRVVAGSAEEP